MSLEFTRDMLAITGGDNTDPFELEVAGNQLNTKLVDIPVPLGQFIAGASTTPIQNIPNYAKTIRRLNVDRVFEGNRVQISVRGTGQEARFVVRLGVLISTFAATNLLGATSGTSTDLTGQSFQQWSNPGGATGFGTLPNATPANVGNTFFFRAQSNHVMTISTARVRDRIVYGNDFDNQTNAVVSNGTAGISLILRCSKRRVWRAESVSDPVAWGLV